MQKLDYTESLKELKTSLKSEEIINLINSLPVSQAVPQVKALTPIIIESKSNYDKVDIASTKFEILQALGAEKLYSQETIGNVINGVVHTTIQNHQKVQLFLIPAFQDFYNFHYSLIQATLLSEQVLFKNNLLQLHAEDTIIFRVLSENELELAKYSKILSLIRELIEIIQRILKEEEQQVSVTLLDSGSDTNLGVKSSIEITRSLFQIFKEVWDWMLNRKFYKNKLRNSGLMDNLSVMVAIHEAKEKGAIDEETAKIYRESIIIKTEDLLELNVLPKELYELKTQNDSRKLLAEFSEVKMLENKSSSQP